MKIFFDNLIYAWQKSGGISIVWTQLLKRMLRISMPLRFIETKECLKNEFRKTLHIPQTSIIYRSSFLFSFKRYFPIYVKEQNRFIFHSSYYRTCRNRNAINIITVHDFTYEKYSTGLKRWVHSFSKYYAISHADYIICISQNTKKDLLYFFPKIKLEKIHVIYNGVNEAYHVLESVNRYSENIEPFLIFVGARFGYKNFNIAVECAAIVGMRLVIVGSQLTSQEDLFVSSRLQKKYIVCGFLSENELNRYYNKAFALIYPSSYEGFGLPVIEAQRAGCPVIAMDRSSIPEIIGNTQLLVENENAASFAEKVELLKDASLRKKIIAEGIKNAENFSWDKMATDYITLYEKIIKEE